MILKSSTTMSTLAPSAPLHSAPVAASRLGGNASLGGIAWLLALAVMRPSPFDPEWAAALLALAPLVLVPLSLRALALHFPREASIPAPLVVHQLPAAICLQVAFLAPQGPWGAAAAVPWLCWTAMLGAVGARQLWTRSRSFDAGLCFPVAMIFIVIGAGWSVLSRAGIAPLEFKPIIVLLTGIHFHYAGFVLPIVCGASATIIGGRGPLAICGLVLAAVPLTAVGITSTQLGGPAVLEATAAILMSLGGLATALLQWRAFGGRDRTERKLARFAAMCLAAAMGLSTLYGVRFLNLTPGLDIPWMRVLHGTTIAFGFALPTLLAWNFRRSANGSCVFQPGGS